MDTILPFTLLQLHCRVMDPDVQIMYTPSKEKRVTRHSLKVNLSGSHNRKPLPEVLEARINEIWSGQVSENPTLWNGSKFRIESVNESSDDVTFNLGITSYKDFIGTNWSPDAKALKQLGHDDHSDTQVSVHSCLRLPFNIVYRPFVHLISCGFLLIVHGYNI